MGLVDKYAHDIQLFREAWMANSAVTPAALATTAAAAGLELVLDRDIGAEYDVVGRNYANKARELPDAASFKMHQGWLGAEARRVKELIAKSKAASLDCCWEESSTALQLLA